MLQFGGGGKMWVIKGAQGILRYLGVAKCGPLSNQHYTTVLGGAIWVEHVYYDVKCITGFYANVLCDMNLLLRFDTYRFFIV